MCANSRLKSRIEELFKQEDSESATPKLGGIRSAVGRFKSLADKFLDVDPQTRRGQVILAFRRFQEANRKTVKRIGHAFRKPRRNEEAPIPLELLHPGPIICRRSEQPPDEVTSNNWNNRGKSTEKYGRNKTK